MIKNLLLLSCRSSYLDSDKVYPPLGNLYLYSAIKKSRPSVNVVVRDEYSFNTDSWLYGMDAVGVSIMTPQRAEAKKVLDFIKERKPNLPVWAGGPHAKFYLDSLYPEKWDKIVTADGERDIIKLIDGTEQRILTDNIPVAEFKNYAVKPARLEHADFLKGYSYTLDGRTATTMMTAKGCPEHCAFCEDANTMVKWTPQNLVFEEIDDIKSLGYKAVYIFDDIFAIAQKKIEPIARRLKEKDLIYRCNGQARIMTKEFMGLLADTGCREIAFGAETGSQKILNNIHKRTTVSQNYQFVNWCNEFGINCKAFLMLGLPGEDLETIAQTEEFITKSGIKDFQLSIYYPYKGTQIRDAIDKGNKVDLYFEGEGLGAYGQKGGSTECVVRTGALTKDDLIYHRDRLVKQYRPKSHLNKWSDKNDHFFDTHLKQRELWNKS